MNIPIPFQKLVLWCMKSTAARFPQVYKFKNVIVSFLLIFSTHYLAAAPEITSVNPSNGPTSGGNVITITGSGFTGSTAVNFGNRPAASFTVLTDTSLSATVPIGTVGTVDIAVTAASQTSAQSRSDIYTYTQSGWQGILSGVTMDAVTLFNTSTNTITATIPLPSSSLASIITPDNTTIYATNSDQPNIYEIDAAINTISAIHPLPFITGPGSFDLIVSPNGQKLYVSNNTSGYVTVIDVPTNTIDANIFVTTNLGPLSITPDGKTVYVSNFNLSPNNVTTIDTATNTISGNITTGLTPGLVSITPDGTKGYVGNSFANTISVLDIATNTVINTIILPAGSRPYGSSILPNGQTLYIANIDNDTVTVVDIATDAITIIINMPPGSSPFWLASTPDNKTVYVIGISTSAVYAIDVATNTFITALPSMPGEVDDIVISSDPSPVASFFTNDTIIGATNTFDASASLSPIGTIALYSWDFGDGTTAITASPLINHTYTSAGIFNAVLTVTNSAGTSTDQVYSSRFMSNNGGPLAIFSQSVNIAPSPPTNLQGKQRSCNHITQKIFNNIIKWDPPANEAPPAQYRIYRDAQLSDPIGTTTDTQFTDFNRKRCKTYTYYIVSVSAGGSISAPASITIRK